jgi:hypothetical protein
MVEITEEMQKIIDDRVAKAQTAQRIYDYGIVWFTEALAHTGNLVSRGEFLPEAHQMGEQIKNMFIRDMTGKPATEKKDEELAE